MTKHKKHIKANLTYFNRLKKEEPWKDRHILSKYGCDDSIMVERDEPFDAEKERAMCILHAFAGWLELHNMNG